MPQPRIRPKRMRGYSWFSRNNGLTHLSPRTSCSLLTRVSDAADAHHSPFWGYRRTYSAVVLVGHMTLPAMNPIFCAQDLNPIMGESYSICPNMSILICGFCRLSLKIRYFTQSGVTSVPIPSIMTLQTSPYLSQTRSSGFFPCITPAGVPVKIRSPGERGKNLEAALTASRHEKIMSDVQPD